MSRPNVATSKATVSVLKAIRMNWLGAITLLGCGLAAVALRGAGFIEHTSLVATLISLFPLALGGVVKQHFDERLTALQNSNSHIVERLKSSLAHDLARASRLSEREFDSIGNLWKSYVDAFHATGACATGFRHVHTNLSQIDPRDVQEMMNIREFTDQQKRHVLESDNMDKEFDDCVRWNQIREAGKLIYELRDALRKNAIYLNQDIFDRFEEELKLFQRVQSEAQYDRQQRGSMTGAFDFVTHAEANMKRFLGDIRSVLMVHNVDSRLNGETSQLSL